MKPDKQIVIKYKENEDPYIETCFGCVDLEFLEEERKRLEMDIDSIRCNVCATCFYTILADGKLPNQDVLNAFLTRTE